MLLTTCILRWPASSNKFCEVFRVAIKLRNFVTFKSISVNNKAIFFIGSKHCVANYVVYLLKSRNEIAIDQKALYNQLVIPHSIREMRDKGMRLYFGVLLRYCFKSSI